MQLTAVDNVIRTEKRDKYHVIYADPPWETKAGRPFAGYKVVDGVQVFHSVDTKSRELAYPTMTVEEICALNVKGVSNKDCHLYLWVTNQYMNRFDEVLKAWGFKYSTVLTWNKKPMGRGLGGTYSISAEYLVFATRGSLKPLKRITGTVFDVKREYVNGAPCHSRKPSFFADLILEVSPGRKLEMFARVKREGFDAWGNEIENSTDIILK